MVDINLIGDDKTGEEERVEDFTQTSSMDTQELAFEERTETFDTTKTAGFAQKRSYSSLISTLIIFAVIVLLGGAIYFFMFKDDGATEQVDIPTFIPESEDIAETTPPEEDFTSQPPVEEDAESEPDLAQGQQQPQSTFEPPTPTETEQAPTEPPKSTTPPPAPRTTRTESPTPTSTQFLSSSKSAVQSVTNLMTSVPSNLNTTLLSYAGQRLRIEFVANTSAEANDFTDRLSQYFGSGNFTVLSESQVATNGRSVEKVLVSGRTATDGRVSGNERIEFLTLQQAKDWINSSARQNGLDVRQVNSQPDFYTSGYQKTPILARLYGSQSSLVAFLEAMAAKNMNVELTKILLVSPDMATYSDDNLVMVLNMFLYEKS